MDRKHNKIQLEYDNLFFCASIIFPSAVSLFTQTMRLFVSTRSLDTLLMYGLMAVITMKILPKLKYVISIREILLTFGISLAFLLSAMNPISDTSLTRSVVMEILTSSVFVYFGAKLVHDSRDLNKYLRISSLILLLRVLANTYIFNTTIILSVGYSQADGYYLLTGMALLIAPLITEHRIFDIICAAVTLLVTLLTGARGPFLFSGLLLVAGLFLSKTDKNKKPSFYIVIVAALLIIYRYMREIMLFVTSLAGNSSSLRTVNRILNNELFQDSKRSMQFQIAWEYIKEHWFWGSGVVNDRIIINRAMPSLGEVSGSYVHNFFLEVGMQFGFIFGLIISIGMVILIVNAFRHSESNREKLLVIALIMAGFAPLMVSGSYLSHTMFFALLGYCNRQPYTFGA